MAFFECFSTFLHRFIGQSTFSLEPHTLHLIQILYCRCSLLRQKLHTKMDTNITTWEKTAYVRKWAWTHTPLTLVNLAHISSASLTRPALSRYLAHLELIKRSAVSRAWASSIQRAASRMFPACWGREIQKRHNGARKSDNQINEPT